MITDQPTGLAAVQALPAARSVADVPTQHASRYLQQLCKHFAHRIPVTFDEQVGQIAFSMGECRLEAREGILRLIAATPDSSQLTALQEVVARHLVRFAFREELQIAWHPAEAAAGGPVAQTA